MFSDFGNTSTELVSLLKGLIPKVGIAICCIQRMRGTTSVAAKLGIAVSDELSCKKGEESLAVC